MRLDKLISQIQIVKISLLKEYISKGSVTVNGQVVKKPECKVNAL